MSYCFMFLVPGFRFQVSGKARSWFKVASITLGFTFHVLVFRFQASCSWFQVSGFKCQARQGPDFRLQVCITLGSTFHVLVFRFQASCSWFQGSGFKRQAIWTEQKYQASVFTFLVLAFKFQQVSELRFQVFLLHASGPRFQVKISCFKLILLPNSAAASNDGAVSQVSH